jgi:hypothetical protein
MHSRSTSTAKSNSTNSREVHGNSLMEADMNPNSRAAISILLCLQMLAPMSPALAASPSITNCKDENAVECRKESGPVTVEIGQPSSWSLAQAHYLLAQMHRTNRTLNTRMPTLDQLDPNRANASQLEILRTLVQFDAGFDQSVSLKNEAELQSFRDKEERKAQAQIQLRQRQKALEELNEELQGLNQRIAVLEVQDDLADKARGDAPPSDAERQRKEELARLKALQEDMVARRTALQGEITSLTTTANETIAAPSVTSGAPPTSTPASGSTPTSPATAGGADSTALKDFAAKALNSFQTPPSVAASVALDNFLGMQYEIIAKQLTLLRDEVGPDERIVFFELPASIYTVDQWADDLIAQVRWQVTDVYAEKPTAEIACQSLKDLDAPVALFRGLRVLPEAAKSDCLFNLREKALEALLDSKTLKDLKHDKSVTDDVLKQSLEEKGAWNVPKTLGLNDTDSEFRYPITMQMMRETYGAKLEENDTSEVRPDKARALEIIPRQSALNINEYQAITRNSGFLGLLKLLSGFGAQLNVQRQKEIYGSLLQQEVYASGYGKGTPSFGWTFGPLPGSRRLAPGQRTTYAVLAVPRNALAVRITADAWAFPRWAQPGKRYRVRHRSFLVRIPSEETERFWVKSVVYSPVQKGRAATVVVQGNSFSPQLGVLVNGISLKRVISISRAESDEAEIAFPEAGIQGEFEITNSGSLILRFSMGKDFVGTPIITLVTPERTNAINSFPLEVNFRNESSLSDASVREPMFFEEFKAETTLDEASPASIGLGSDSYKLLQKKLLPQCAQHENFVFYRLNGSGLRPKAEISVGGKPLEVITLAELIKKIQEDLCKDREPVQEPLALQESTHSYLLYFERPTDARWPVRYRQQTRQSFDEARFEHVPPVAADFKFELRNYRFNRQAKAGEVDLTLSFPKTLSESYPPHVCFYLPKGDHPISCTEIRKDQDGKYRAHCDVPAGQGEHDFVSFEVDAELQPEKGKKGADATRPGCPYYYATAGSMVWLFDLRLPVRPLLEKVEPVLSSTPRRAVLSGSNLHRVTAVLFGNQVAEVDSATSVLPDLLNVKIPAKEVPAGMKEQVPIVLQTEDGAIPTGFNFEYAGPPKKEEKKEEAAGKG